MKASTNSVPNDGSTVPVGGVVLAEDDITFNEGRATATLTVRNTGDRPIQVGSHFHFFEVNRALDFDRAEAFGMHLNIPATTAVRFEPGDEKEVELVAYAGKQRAYGFNGLVNGWCGQGAYVPEFTRGMDQIKERGFKNTPAPSADASAGAPAPSTPSSKK